MSKVKNIRTTYLNRRENLLKSGVFTKDAIIIPVGATGVLDYSTAYSKIQIIGENGVENISDWTVSLSASGGVTAFLSGDTITVTGLSVDAAIINITLTHKSTGISFIKSLQVLKSSVKDLILVTTDLKAVFIPVDNSGTILDSGMADYTTVNLLVYNGTTLETGWTWEFKTATSGCVPVVSPTSLYINDMVIDAGTVTMTVSKTGYADREISIPVAKVYQGETVLNASSIDGTSIILDGSGKASVPFNPSYFENAYGVIQPKNIAWYNASLRTSAAGFAAVVTGAAAFGSAYAGNDYTLNSGESAQSKMHGARVFAGGLHADLSTRRGAQQVEEFVLRTKAELADTKYELVDGAGDGYWLKEGVALLKGTVLGANITGTIIGLYFEFTALLKADSDATGTILEFTITKYNKSSDPGANLYIETPVHVSDNKINFPIKVRNGEANIYWTAYIRETVVLQP